MKKQFMARQGDVLILESSIPEGALKAKLDEERVVLAYGEVTGHAHAIARGAIPFEFDETKYLEVTEAVALLRHEEHDVIQLPQTTYEIVHQFEYTPEELRRVVD